MRTDTNSGSRTTIRAKDSQPLGYGPYQFVGTDGAAATLTENKYYDGTAVERADLKLIWSDTTDRLSQITGGTADLADLELTDTEIASIRETNEKYLNVCRVAYENAQTEKTGEAKSEWLKSQISAICGEYEKNTD